MLVVFTVAMHIIYKKIGSTVILMGKPPKLISFSFFIHPFHIGFGIHDVLRSWIKKEIIMSTRDAGQGDCCAPVSESLFI